MARLGDVINSMREDFIVVHLCEPCSYCRCYISGSNRHACCTMLGLSDYMCPVKNPAAPGRTC